MTNKTKEDANGTGYEWEYAKKIDNRTTTQKILNFIYDPQTHAFMGRTAKSWGGILLFYAIFYSILALLFAICMKVLLSTLNDESPKWTLEESLLGQNPGLGFRPQTEDPETASVIWYNVSNQQNVESWINLINKFFDKEYTTNSSNAKNCTHDTKLKPGEFCRVRLEDFGPCSKTFGYGYGLGKPCVFIKLNRIFKWTPEFYKDELDTPMHMPTDLQELIKKENERRYVWVSCEGQSPHDKENIGPISYYPSTRGFPGYFYPYTQARKGEYMSPLVAVQFTGLRPNVITNVECKAWAKNIQHKASSQVREGSVHFELQIDDIASRTVAATSINASNAGNRGLNDNTTPKYFPQERISI